MADSKPINAIFVENVSRRIITIPGLSTPVTCIEISNYVQHCGCSLVPDLLHNYAPDSRQRQHTCTNRVVIIHAFACRIAYATQKSRNNESTFPASEKRMETPCFWVCNAPLNGLT
jgi:hypothetical protein